MDMARGRMSMFFDFVIASGVTKMMASFLTRYFSVKLAQRVTGVRVPSTTFLVVSDCQYVSTIGLLNSTRFSVPAGFVFTEPVSLSTTYSTGCWLIAPVPESHVYIVSPPSMLSLMYCVPLPPPQVLEASTVVWGKEARLAEGGWQSLAAVHSCWASPGTSSKRSRTKSPVQCRPQPPPLHTRRTQRPRWGGSCAWHRAGTCLIWMLVFIKVLAFCRQWQECPAWANIERTSMADYWTHVSDQDTNNPRSLDGGLKYKFKSVISNMSSIPWGSNKMSHILHITFCCTFFSNSSVCIVIPISLKLVPIANISAFVQVITWYWTGDKPLSEGMMTHIPSPCLNKFIHSTIV